ncbi:MAG: KDO2-lipid IV(A) lauroyltransferase [Cryomorphaceae bacterium]|jgi:KDO2-lipid IV(A) lauroyltransferase
MQFLGYAAAYVFLWTITWFPLGALLLIGDLFYFLAYRVIGYRKDIVRSNLKNSFPEKSIDEIIEIEKRFYRHLGDSFIEWFYPLHRSAKQLKPRYVFKNPELLNTLYSKGISVAGVLGHYGNWEWLSLLPTEVKHKVWAIHKPLKNPYFNRLINGLRSKYGVHMISTKDSYRKLKTEKDNGEVTMTYFLADQSPQESKIKYWSSFLGQDTPVFMGAEQIAKKLDMAVVFFDIRKVSRGYYEIEFKLLSENPKSEENHAITDMHVKALQARIMAEPEWWLWSHKRWKHKRSK